jgi:serine/threonine protein kinase
MTTAALPSRFGPYEILAPLGAGGMGQVYRARDTRLQRFVAIKILHDTAALDPVRQRRFSQEAAAASALNHPNILTVFDIGLDGGVQYLVSELIEGESLRAEMDRGRAPLKRVIDIVHQVAEGLAAAHGAGIVHRDLKPENVMLTPDGRVKIVDFGLAKTVEGESVLAGPPSTTLTAEGLIMGTVPYMSPEQARGAPADFRSDQFALGVVLYELITATHPFKRETSVQTLSAIIGEDPPDPASVMATPVVIRWLIRRLLAKNPRDRFAHTADLAADLRTIRENLSEATTASGVTTAVEPSRPRWQLRAAAGTIAAAGVVGALWALPIPDSPPRFDRFVPFATDAAYQNNPAWSPDGKAIAYEAEVDGVVQIHTRTLGSPEAIRVTKSRFDCFSPIWAADGYIYYISRKGLSDALWRVSPIADAPPDVFVDEAIEAAISPDGRTLFFLRQDASNPGGSALWVASPPDAPPAPYTRGGLQGRLGTSAQLRFSPDGSRLLIWLAQDSLERRGFWEIRLPGGESRALLAALTGPGLPFASFGWLPDNRHIVLSHGTGPTPGTHLAIADTRTDRLTPLTMTPGNEQSVSVSPDGRTVAFTRAETDFDLVEIPIDGSPSKVFLKTTRDEYDPAVSPVNSQYAFVTNRTGSEQIWLGNKEGYPDKPLVTDEDFEGVTSKAIGSLAISPDGTKLAFQRASSIATPDRPEGARLWIKSLSGGKAFHVEGEETYQDAPTWSPTGDSIAYLAGKNGPAALVKSQVGGRSSAVPLLRANIPQFIARPQWSPDGDWILCETDQGLMMIAADGSERTRVIAPPGWLTYAWDKDGRTVYGLRPTEDEHHIMLVRLDVQTQTERIINADLGTIQQALQPIRGFSRLRTGGFVTSLAHVRSDVYLLEGLQLPRKWWERFWWGGRPETH